MRSVPQPQWRDHGEHNWQDARQPVVLINHVKINNLLPDASLPDSVQSLLHGEILVQRRNVFACDRQNWQMQVV